jgi:hypothetical protein
MVNMTVEDQCRSVWVCPEIEKRRCHFVHYMRSTSRSGPEGIAGSDEHIVEVKNNESILDALIPRLDDFLPMNSHEYEEAMKEYDEELMTVDQPPADL